MAGANIPADTTPRYIVIEGLDIRSARPPYTFAAANGSVQAYSDNASSIYIEKGENITVCNCLIHESGNGFFVASSDSLASRNILVESNYIFDNGIVDSIYQHNNYTAAIGITFQYNRFGLPRAGALATTSRIGPRASSFAAAGSRAGIGSSTWSMPRTACSSRATRDIARRSCTAT